ncbi:MAG: class I SAM-dependent methyltransferase [Bdellovibrionales bacterium]|nr:class I SAM-dependent methyltransferase [Bdellovibrionales bacterium]
MIPSKIIQSLNIARSGVYFLESLPLALVSRFVTHPDLPPPSDEQVRSLWKHILKLHKREAEALEHGAYTWKALEIESPWRHLRSFMEVMSDGVRVAWRMKLNKTKHFESNMAQELTQDLPDYYTRNFHFQTDGYLSEASARRYDHQVEILFSGTAGAMRRLILPVLKSTTQAHGRWLELGSGTGSATRPVLATFPRVRVTALDLSSPYLKVARENLNDQSKVDFVQGDATELTFKEESFSAVYSVYVLHELPKPEREKLVREAYRVLKPGGVLVIADSLQIDDEPELNWALERFPKVYHEPFYKNYSRDRLEDLLERVTGEKALSEHAFFTKVVWVKKP